MGESTSREAVIRRVRAMLVLAQEDRGATPAEREVAARKAQALAGRHGLDLIELTALAEDPDRELGELLVELPARHQGWAAMLLDEIAAALGLQARPTRDHRARLLSGPAGRVAHGSRAYAEALAAIQAGHEQLTAHTTPAARRARRFLTIRYPDPVLEAEVLAQLRYTPTGRLIAQVAETLALRPATARDVAEAIKSRQVAAVDADPEALEGPYFAGAIDEVTQRLRELEAHRHPKPPSDPQTYDPGRDPRADTNLEELLSALLANERPRRRRGRRERTRPRPLPAWDPAAHHAGQKAGAHAPIGLHHITSTHTDASHPRRGARSPRSRRAEPPKSARRHGWYEAPAAVPVGRRAGRGPPNTFLTTGSGAPPGTAFTPASRSSPLPTNPAYNTGCTHDARRSPSRPGSTDLGAP